MKEYEKYLIKESTSYPIEKVAKEIAKLTDNNSHTEAVKLGCEWLGLDMEVRELDRIIYRIERNGQISTEDKRTRDKYYDRMMATAEDELSASDYKKFHNAF